MFWTVSGLQRVLSHRKKTFWEEWVPLSGQSRCCRLLNTYVNRHTTRTSPRRLIFWFQVCISLYFGTHEGRQMFSLLTRSIYLEHESTQARVEHLHCFKDCIHPKIQILTTDFWRVIHWLAINLSRQVHWGSHSVGRYWHGWEPVFLQRNWSFTIEQCLFGTSLTIADGIFTPAVSVTSAVAGIAVAKPSVTSDTTPISIAILLVLFLSQRFGTAKLAFLFSPSKPFLLLITSRLDRLWKLRSCPNMVLAAHWNRYIQHYIPSWNFPCLWSFPSDSVLVIKGFLVFSILTCIF